MRTSEELESIASRLLKTPGIFGVAIGNSDQPTSKDVTKFVPTEERPEYFKYVIPAVVLSSAVDLMRDAETSYLRIMYSHGSQKVTLVAAHCADVDIAIEIPHGHDVMKSIHRMLRRALAPRRSNGKSAAAAVPVAEAT